MNNIQPNGDTNKTFVNKPIESPMETGCNDPDYVPQTRSLRNWGRDRVRMPNRRHIPPMDRNGEEHLTNQKKQRYWNSWEELYIVELWRRYKDEVTIINVPLPVYRKMMIAMRNRNMLVTAQDCRRKINTLNTKYKQELKRIEIMGGKSEWRLFPLLHCVMEPKIKEFDAWHENKIIKRLLEKMPKPVEVKPPAATSNIDNQQSPQIKHLQTLSNSNSNHARPLPTLNTTPPLSTAVYMDSSSPYKLPSATAGRFDKPSILPFRNRTLEKIEQLRQDNNRLSQQRDEDLKSLHLAEENFRNFETFVRIWTEQKELEFRRIQLLADKCVVNTENEENHNVEQQLQETVVTK